MTPKIYIIAESTVSNGMRAFLEDIGATEWTTDAHSEAEAITEFAARLCYMSFDNSLNSNLTDRPPKSNYEYIQSSIIAHRHGSVLEHATVSLLFHGVSRVVTHEQVRHRAGVAYSQESGRYVRVQELYIWRPSVIFDHATSEANDVFYRAEKQAIYNYKELERIYDIDNQPFAVKKALTSAFRRILPEGRPTSILVTANHRAWRNMIEQRSATGAEEEINALFDKVADLLKDRFPAIYADWDGSSFTYSKV